LKVLAVELLGRKVRHLFNAEGDVAVGLGLSFWVGRLSNFGGRLVGFGVNCVVLSRLLRLCVGVFEEAAGAERFDWFGYGAGILLFHKMIATI
jgi:hypothetical protein